MVWFIKESIVEDVCGTLKCDCDYFNRKGVCWHVERVFAQQEFDRMRKKKMELRKGQTAFDRMVQDRIQIYKELERKRKLHTNSH